MRYFLRLNLNGFPVKKDLVEHQKLERYLPIKKSHPTSQAVFLQTFSYENDDPSLVSANGDRPFYEDKEYFFFIGGHVLYRIKETETKGEIVPAPKEVFEIIRKHGDKHYDVIKGSYYLLLLDKIRNSAIVYSAPMYVFPVFFTIQSDTLVFSNILECVLKERPSQAINERGLVEFSLFDHPIGMNTPYKDVYSMTGGARIDIRDGSFKEQTVYDISKWIHHKPKPRKDSLPELNTVLNKIINNYTSHVKKFNISLTGGFDGRLNFSLINPIDYKRLQAFSYGKSGSLQIAIPKQISEELGFPYKPVHLDEDFVQKYAELGRDTILLTGGLTPFIRANYLYGYEIIKDFSRNCILGQCDMIRPLNTNPAGSIFNKYSQGIFFQKDFSMFLADFQHLGKNGFLNNDLYSAKTAEDIYSGIVERYISQYPQCSDHEKYFLFLFKESMIKFWHTECHAVDLIVDDFMSFSDLDYIELLSSSEYYGLYKGIFASNQFTRRKAHDLYIDLMTINNDKLNDFRTDRMFKPKWLKYGLFGLCAAYFAKYRVKKRNKKFGNDTFGGMDWSKTFYDRYHFEILERNKLFNLSNLNNIAYSDDNAYRLDRHLSLKLWFDYMDFN